MTIETAITFHFAAFDAEGTEIASWRGRATVHGSREDALDQITECYDAWVDFDIPVDWDHAVRTVDGKATRTHRLSQAETDHFLASR